MNKRDRQRFDAIRHRLERTTPGPHTTARSGTLVMAQAGTPEERVIAATDPLCQLTVAQNQANAAFFAHAWSDIVWLTERVRDLERSAKGQASERARRGL